MDVAETLRKAISEGAPLYNDGHTQACYHLYRNAALEVIDSAACTPEISTVLRTALTDALQDPSELERAWIMRRAFDAILDGSVAAAARLAALPPDAAEFLVLDFEGSVPADPRWYVLDDDVMGGTSRSAFSYDPETKAAAFAGSLSTQGGGGFASVRSRPWGGWCLERAKGVRLMVMGDGRNYKLNAKMDDAFDGIVYQRDFPTQASTWQQVDLLFDTFKPNFRGRMVPGAPLLRGGKVRQMGFMVSKFSDMGGLTPGFRPGSFKLAVKWLKGVL